MKLLQDILYQVGIKQVIGSTHIEVGLLVFDSRKVVPECVFVAMKGTLSDGHKFIDSAIEKGAAAIVCQEMPVRLNPNITYVLVDDSHAALGIMASNFFDNPSERIKLIGITGTNGKTTTSTILFDLLQLLGQKVGLISTVENKINERIVPATHTTPDAVSFNELLAQMVAEGCTYCFMEVSSHALHQHRVTGAKFAGAIFTNISHDHLDYHQTFDAYIAAKKMLFDMLPGDSFALVNQDDKHGAIMLQNCKAKVKRTYALKSMGDFKVKVIENQFGGLQLNIDGLDLYAKMVGRFNAYNLLCAYATAVLLDFDKMEVLTALSSIDPVAGRFQYVISPDQVTAIVDYAHTPDALKNVLKTIDEIRTRNEEVITVVGCGGNRDAAKRPEMARIACKLSDRVIFTSDNPRNEDPESIIQDMQSGVEPQDYRKTNVIVNRKEAIKMACSIARKGDIILIAGKGHEKYQEINGERFPFDDLAIVNDTFKLLNN